MEEEGEEGGLEKDIMKKVNKMKPRNILTASVRILRALGRGEVRRFGTVQMMSNSR